MAVRLVDTHSHIYLPEFDEDRDDVVARAVNGGVTSILLPNIDSTTMDRLLECVETYPDVCFPMAGLHPTSVNESYKEELDFVRRMLQTDRKFVAVGEIGVDLYWDDTYRNEQLDAFDAQLDMAVERRLPVVVHCRNAFDEMFSVLMNHVGRHLTGVAHSFSGTLEQVERLLGQTDFYVGVNGIATFKKSDLPELLKHVPIERVVAETDSPYLAPVPHRGRRNESAFVVDVVRKIAEIYGLGFEETAAIMSENAQRLFNLSHCLACD